GKFVMELEFVTAEKVIDVGPASYLVSGIIAPLVGVADLEHDVTQFIEGLFFRFGSHPWKGFDVVMQSADEIVNHLERRFLGFGRKRAGYVFLAEGLAELAVG